MQKQMETLNLIFKYFLLSYRFWLLLEHPKKAEQHINDNTAVGEQSVENNSETIPVNEISGFINKLQSIPPLLKYMIPLCSVYLFEYFINQGLVRNYISIFPY